MVNLAERAQTFPSAHAANRVGCETEAVVAACRALYDAVWRLDDLACRQAGIARSDMRCLTFLENGPQPARRIGEALGLTAGSVTTLLDRLEARGLARRQPDPHDRRAVLVMPTQAGFETVARFYNGMAERIREELEGDTPEECRAAIGHIDRFRTAIETATET